MATLTVDFAGVTQLGCAVVAQEWSGVDTTDPTAQSATNSGLATSLTVTLGAIITQCVGLFAHLASEATTPGALFTESGDVNAAGPNLGAEGEYGASAVAVDASWATSSNCVGLACELRASGTPTFVQSSGALYDSADAASYNHTLTAPSAGNVIILAIFNPRANTTVTVPTISGMSLTWTQEATVLRDPGSGTRLRGTMFFGVPPASGSFYRDSVMRPKLAARIGRGR